MYVYHTQICIPIRYYKVTCYLVDLCKYRVLPKCGACGHSNTAVMYAHFNQQCPTKISTSAVHMCVNLPGNFFQFKLTLFQCLQVVYSQSSLLTLRRPMSYIYGAPILDVSRPHTTTQHSR